MSKEKESIVTTRDNGNEPSPELVEILKKAPKGAFDLTKQEQQFLNSSVGKEIIKY